MTEDDAASAESPRGTIVLNLADIGEWEKVYAYCIEKRVPIEEMSRRDLTIKIPRKCSEEIPKEVLGNIKIYKLAEAEKRIKEYRARTIHTLLRKKTLVKHTTEDELLVQQLIPEHLLPRNR